ncbi:MAG: glycosyltransferase [Oscillospiraceae bacterium]|nr:glycosyltransferase [Oscillospiraceae bacterium]
MPKFSIIIPVYNTEKYVKQCLDSVLAQSNKDLELIVIDDGSDDNSLKITEDAIKEIPQSTLIKNNHGGVCRARNAGIEIAKGDYICFVDSDDILFSNYIERLSQAADMFAPDVIYFHSAGGINAEKKAVDESDIFGFLNEDDIKFLSSASLYHTPEVDNADGKYYGISSFSACMQVYRRALFIDNGVRYTPGIKRSEDGLINLEMLHYARCGAVIKEQLYIYRIDNVSATRSYISDLDEVFDLRDASVKSVIERLYSDDAEIYIEKYYSSLIFQMRVIAENQIFNDKNSKPAQEKINEFKKLISKPDYAHAIKVCGAFYLTPEDREFLTVVNSGKIKKIPAMVSKRKMNAKISETVKKPVKRMLGLLNGK